MEPLDTYLKQNGLSHLDLSRLTINDLQKMLRVNLITNDIYDHLVTLSSTKDSELDIVQTKINMAVFNGLVFLDGFPTTDLISEGRTILQVSEYINKNYATKETLMTM